ncbi:MAG TPA: class I SAM-dependent methyltransferase [Streptosporangiaceae bacterium]|nr:class I SAM-dependent methyltransferase [Streptosporangiaceae bacterium]
MSDPFSQESWDERYRSRSALWSRNPNVQLVAEAGELAPGNALDVGAGEGADAIWLASRGWRVTAVDLSAVALERASAHASAAGPEIAGRIEWVHEDVTCWDPGSGRYDLVSAQYVHLPLAARQAMLRRLTAAVAPGGSLLVVCHHPSDLQTTVPRPQMPELFFTGDDIAAGLDAGQWTIVTNAAPGRTAVDPEGNEVTVHDTVLRAARRAD